MTSRSNAALAGVGGAAIVLGLAVAAPIPREEPRKAWQRGPRRLTSGSPPPPMPPRTCARIRQLRESKKAT